MIFVNMACYRDPECAPTVRDLFAKARYPRDIVVAVVMQTAPHDNLLFSAKNVRMLVVHDADSKGVCWARNMGYRLWDGEDHILQVDSHMRFAEHWDAKMLRQLDRCGVAKPLLSTYPPAYEPPDRILERRPVFLVAKHFEDDGRLVQHGAVVDAAPMAPKPSAFIAAGFIFGPSLWIHEAPYDPQLYFWGEETTLAARLWTHGWDVFGPTKTLLWHWYNRIGGKTPWQNDPDWHVRDRLSKARMRHLLGIAAAPPEAIADLDRYGFGSVRSFEAYQAFAGVDFKARTIAPHALAGEWGNPIPTLRSATYTTTMATPGRSSATLSTSVACHAVDPGVVNAVATKRDAVFPITYHP